MSLGLVAVLAAADATSPDPAGLRVSTVGVDTYSGRLVRRVSRPVAAKPVAVKTLSEREVKPRVVEARDVDAGPARPAAVASAAGEVRLDRVIRQAAERYSIDPAFVHAVIKAESNYNPRARSPKGALGLMQLMPRTAAELGVGNVYSPAENVEAGVRHLRYLLDLYQPLGASAQTRLSLAAYNAGEGAVDRFGGVPPYWETQAYVRRVNDLWKRYRTVMPGLAPEPAPKKYEGPRIVRIEDPSGVTRYVTESQ